MGNVRMANSSFCFSHALTREAVREKVEKAKDQSISKHEAKTA